MLENMVRGENAVASVDLNQCTRAAKSRLHIDLDPRTSDRTAASLTLRTAF